MLLLSRPKIGQKKFNEKLESSLGSTQEWHIFCSGYTQELNIGMYTLLSWVEYMSVYSTLSIEWILTHSTQLNWMHQLYSTQLNWVERNAWVWVYPYSCLLNVSTGANKSIAVLAAFDMVRIQSTMYQVILTWCEWKTWRTQLWKHGSNWFSMAYFFQNYWCEYKLKVLTWRTNSF